MESRPGVPPPKNGHAVAFFMLAPSHSCPTSRRTECFCQVLTYAVLRLNRGSSARQHSAFIQRENPWVRLFLAPHLNHRSTRHSNDLRRYVRQLPLWPDKTQPRYIMNACEVDGGRAFAFCKLPPFGLSPPQLFAGFCDAVVRQIYHLLCEPNCCSPGRHYGRRQGAHLRPRVSGRQS